MADNKKEEKVKKQKRPTAIKRYLQSVKSKVRNRSFKASVATSIRSFKDSVSKNEKETVQARLKEVYSIIDKGVKKGIFKQNKAGRVKSQMSTLATKS
jgi:small subunit ribosomal protein S20